MGVPQFIRLLSYKCPLAFQTYEPGDSRIDALFIDFNSVIHGCAAETDTQTQCIDRACRHVEYLRDKIDPGRLVYVAIDGAPPRAKMQQQRCRRYKNQPRQKHWDTNAITPGTQFMSDLSRRLVAHFAQDARVVVSDASEPGEGEQKINQYIAGMSSHAGTIAIHGLDADLVMLALSLNLEAADMVVLREADLEGTMQVVSISEVRRWIADNGVPCKDFIALVSLFGNDFLPGLSALMVKDGDFNAVFQAYNDIMDEAPDPGGGVPLLMDRGPPELFGLDIRVLLKLINRLARREAGMLSRKDATLMESRKWQNIYYNATLGERHAESVHDMVVDYVATMAWSVAYHHQCILSIGWYYIHTHAPLMSDVASVLSSLDPMVMSGIVQRQFARMDAEYVLYKTLDPPMDQLDWNLMLVLPPRSFNLIRDKRAHLVAKSSYMFPSSFNANVFLLMKQYQHIPSLPPIHTPTLIHHIQYLGNN